MISIIALLATIGAALSGVASRKSQGNASSGLSWTNSSPPSRATSADFNQYPPDNAKDGVNANPAVHPLYYELVGTVSSNQGHVYRPWTSIRTGRPPRRSSAAFNGAGGFVNSAVAPAKPKSLICAT